MAAADAPNYAQRLGIHKDQIVQELGWDEDTDDDIRADIEDACGGELLDEDSDEVVDVVLLWWRDDDGDLVDRADGQLTDLLGARGFPFANVEPRVVRNREARTVAINDHDFQLTEAALETLAVLAEARLDDEVLTGAQIEAVISGRNESDCEEAAGATRIKRLRDALGNQMVAALLVKTVARRGYALSVGKDVIQML